jgi:tetratricopeptide (TPR) repeat protein
VLEDCHWIDALSQELLDLMAHEIAELPVLLLLVYRPVHTTDSSYLYLQQIDHFLNFTELRLQDFTTDEATALIRLKLRQLFGKDFDGMLEADADNRLPDLIQRITEKAEGNPFFIDEMVNLIHDKGIDPSNREALVNLDLPNSLYNLIVSRIDQLEEAEKITIKVASVLGRLFRANWLWNIYPALGTPTEVKQYLTNLSRLDLTPLDKPEPEAEYLFKHVVTQEIAYESLAYLTRTTLHEQAGLFIERTYSNEIDQNLDLLAYHYGRSHNTDKQTEYFRKAGEAAQNSYANEAAIDYYRRLLPLLPSEAQPAMMLKLGEILQIVGKWSEAESFYRDSLTLAQNLSQTHDLARAQRALGALLRNKGSSDEALAFLEQARLNFEQLDDQEGRSHAIGNEGLVYARRGEYEQALACYQQQLDIANAIDFQTGVSAAIGNMGNVYILRGEYTQALAFYQRKIELDTKIHKPSGVSMATGNIATIYYEQGNYSQALTYYNRKLQLDTEIGERQSVGRLLNNIGQVYYGQGYYANALSCYTQTLQMALRLDEQQLIVVAILNIADTALALQEFSQAEKNYTLAITFSRKAELPLELCSSLLGQARLYEQQGLIKQAQILNSEALEKAREFGYKDIKFEAGLQELNLRHKLAEISDNEFETSLTQMLANTTSKTEQVAIYFGLWSLQPNSFIYKDVLAKLYAGLYTESPKIEYGQHYQHLTGQTLAEPPLLPALPAIISNHSLNLENLLANAENLLAYM